MSEIEFTSEMIYGIVSSHEVIVTMGSQSDWPAEKGMKTCYELLCKLGVKTYPLITSAHRTPDRVYMLAEAIESKQSLVRAVVAGAGGAAHLPGLLKSHLLYTPVFGVPIKSDALSGVDSLYSIVQMPPGVPVSTMAIGKAGAVNAAICAAEVVGLVNPVVRQAVINYRTQQTLDVGLDPRQTT